MIHSLISILTFLNFFFIIVYVIVLFDPQIEMCVVFLCKDHTKRSVTFHLNFIETGNLDKQQTQKCKKQLTVQLH